MYGLLVFEVYTGTLLLQDNLGPCYQFRDSCSNTCSLLVILLLLLLCRAFPIQSTHHHRCGSLLGVWTDVPSLFLSRGFCRDVPGAVEALDSMTSPSMGYFGSVCQRRSRPG